MPKFDHILQPEIVKRLDSVIRYSSIPIAHNESVSQHSYWVAMYALLIHKTIGGEDRLTKDLLIAALVHDLAEAKTGDVVRTFKYSSELLKKEVDNAEKLIIESFPVEIQSLFKKPFDITYDDGSYIKDVVKAADFVSLFRYMRKEAALHNMEIIPFYNRMITDIHDMCDVMRAKLKTSPIIYPQYLHQLYGQMLDNAEKVAVDCFGVALKDPYWNHDI
jgi:5'-deoxynucleotidase YfbR-like HD superfamily hydrolase